MLYIHIGISSSNINSRITTITILTTIIIISIRSLLPRARARSCAQKKGRHVTVCYGM